MKIALVHDYLNQIGGAERVLKSFTDIYPQAPIYTLIHNPDEVGEYFRNKKIITSFLQKAPLGLSRFKWYLPFMPAAIEGFDLTRYDVVLSDSSSFAKGVITGSKTSHVCYCHTPTRYLWSDSWQYIEELKEGNFIIRKFLPLILQGLRQWDYLAAQRVDKFIANSHFVAQRIKKYYKRDSTVIYPPVDTDKFYISKDVEDYYLAIARLRPYKRVDLLIETFNELRLPLKIIGEGWEIKYLKKIARKNIEFLGYVSEEEKARALSHCKAFLHPQEEDFGIAAVEAMASGRPVIAYKSGGALETVVEGETGVFFEEQTWESLADTVVKFKAENFDPQKIKQHAERFNEKRFKDEIREFIKKNSL